MIKIKKKQSKKFFRNLTTFSVLESGYDPLEQEKWQYLRAKTSFIYFILYKFGIYLNLTSLRGRRSIYLENHQIILACIDRIYVFFVLPSISLSGTNK